MMKSHQYIHDHAIFIHLLIAKFTSTLTVYQKRLFDLILEIIMKEAENQKEQITAMFKRMMKIVNQSQLHPYIQRI